MKEIYSLNQKSNFPSSKDKIQPELETDILNYPTASAIIQALEIEKLEGRKRRIIIKIQIPYSLEQVWQILTDYEAFMEFMPSLVESKRLEHPTGGIRLQQVRSKNFMGMKFSGRSVFDIKENFPHEIHYQLIEGDMKALNGYWRLEPWNLSESKVGTNLIYDFIVLPKPIFPMALLERILSHDLPLNMIAISKRLEEVFGS